MTLTQARTIMWNHAAYTANEVKKAIVTVLATLDATDEDIDRATGLAVYEVQVA
jgi:hypothetical protein